MSTTVDVDQKPELQDDAVKQEVLTFLGNGIGRSSSIPAISHIMQIGKRLITADCLHKSEILSERTS